MSNLDFIQHSHAVIIGIDKYHEEYRVPKLSTPVKDATALGELLSREYGFQVHCLCDEQAKEEDLRQFFGTTLPGIIGDTQDQTRLLFYFAGHGVVSHVAPSLLENEAAATEDAETSEGTWLTQQGFLLPQNAGVPRPGSHGSDDPVPTFLPMSWVYEQLEKLNCRHTLVILDCCFAGAFFQGASRQVRRLRQPSITEQRYQHYLRHPAWQLITSTAFNEEAQDVSFDRKPLGRRGQSPALSGHSPFAQALLDGLSGEADGNGDGVITPLELMAYIDDRMLRAAEAYNQRQTMIAAPYQTPQFAPLPKHGQGQFVLRRKNAKELLQAQKLETKNNPYRGLKPYQYRHANQFFGRDDEVQRLLKTVEKQPLIILTGASGTGKSSLVRAGVLPALKIQNNAQQHNWLGVPPCRPGLSPTRSLLAALQRTDDEKGDKGQLLYEGHHDPSLTEATKTVEESWATNPEALAILIGQWRHQNPERRLLIVIDQAEELVSMTRDSATRHHFIHLLLEALQQHSDMLRILFTVRTDFEVQVIAEMEKSYTDRSQLKAWLGSARLPIRPMTQDQLKQAIEAPASTVDLFFSDKALVDQIVNEVVNMPGALPLLSFALERMFLEYLDSGREIREITWEDYRRVGHLNESEMGAIISSLQNRAEEIYNNLPDALHQATMRRLLLRMVSTQGGELARRRVYQEEWMYPETKLRRFRARDIETPVQLWQWFAQSKDQCTPILQSAFQPKHWERCRSLDKLQKRVRGERSTTKRLWLALRCSLTSYRSRAALAKALNALLKNTELASQVKICLGQAPGEENISGAYWWSADLRSFVATSAPGTEKRRVSSLLNRQMLADLCPPLRCENERISYVIERLTSERLIVAGSEEG